MRSLLCLLALAAASPAQAAGSAGGQFSVSVEVVRRAAPATVSLSPPRLALGPDRTSSLLTVRNDTARAVTYQLRLASDAALPGAARLVFFPRTLALQPYQERRVRVALEGAPPAQATAWLIALHATPPAPAALELPVSWAPQQ
jgi:P pilus assembly chaperone PapD